MAVTLRDANPPSLYLATAVAGPSVPGETPSAFWTPTWTITESPGWILFTSAGRVVFKLSDSMLITRLSSLVIHVLSSAFPTTTSKICVSGLSSNHLTVELASKILISGMEAASVVSVTFSHSDKHGYGYSPRLVNGLAAAVAVKSESP